MTESDKPTSSRGKNRDNAPEERRDEGSDGNSDENRDDDRDDNRNDNRDDNRNDERNDTRASSRPTRSDDGGDGETRETGSGAEPDVVEQRTRSGPLVWLTLLIALVSLGLASYPWWAQRLNPDTAAPVGPSASDFERLARRVDTIRQDSTTEIESLREQVAGIGSLRDRVDALASEFEADVQGPGASVLAERIDQLSARIERLQGERNTETGGLRSRLEELESEVGRRLERFELTLSNVGSNLDRADHDLATRLLLMEVDSLFAIAQNHLVAGGDSGVAVQAWERAMARLAGLEGGEFQGLKDTARRELDQLKAYTPPDFAQQIERLFEMADSVADWPINTIQPAQRPAETGSGEGWRARLGQVVGSLVRVESVDREFLGPDEVDMARERVRSMLQTAALAIVRSRPELARGLIGEAVDAVQQVFDTDASRVSAALARLEDIAANAERIEPPALNDSRAEIARLLGGMR